MGSRTGWVEIAVVALVGLILVWLQRDWRGSSRIRSAWRYLWLWAGANPVTAALWGIVAVHAWMLAGLPTKLRNAVLATHSTNLRHMGRDPVTVLFSSAIWTELPDLLFVTIAAVIVLAPAERWLGTGRAISVYLFGHIAASVLTLLLLDRHLVKSASNAVDVGVSYGAYCLAGLLCFRLPRWWPMVGIVAVGGGLVIARLDDDGATGVGHLIAFTLGLLLYPISRLPTVRAARTGRWIRVPVVV